MPTYSYRCPECGHQYDRFQKITDESLAPCPECGVTGERVITGGAGLLFKGSGFYITDYKRSGDKKASESASEAPAPAKKNETKKSGDKNAGAKS